MKLRPTLWDGLLARVIEQDGDAWGAYVLDLPGCVAAGARREEVTKRVADAIRLHVASLWAEGDAVPTPTTTDTTTVQVA
jgi:predicted RNase H-like HicB family nuclease